LEKVLFPLLQKEDMKTTAKKGGLTRTRGKREEADQDRKRHAAAGSAPWDTEG